MTGCTSDNGDESASHQSLCGGPKEACRCLASDAGDVQCVCDLEGLTCHYGNVSFSCSHDLLDCSDSVDCERTTKYAEVCADVGDDQVELRIVRSEEPNDEACATITCRQVSLGSVRSNETAGTCFYRATLC